MEEEKMSNKDLFKKRVYGVQIIKSKNSNYNADFTGSPRTLPDGTVYSTDKVNKFNIRKYLGRNDDKLIFTKTTYKHNLKPMVLKEVYEYHFGDVIKQGKLTVLNNLLKKLDVRLFGATFAPKGADGKNISIHGPVQISYGVNRFDQLKDSGMYTDQIGSPYASGTSENADQTTLGSQTRSQEAHYVHHFSINPKNLVSYIKQMKEELEKRKKQLEEKKKKLKENKELSKKEQDELNEINKQLDYMFQLLTVDDVKLLKQAMVVATTYYDSTSKKDSENELLLWVELKEDSEKILKNFTDLIDIVSSNNGKTQIDFNRASNYLSNFSGDINNIDVFYDKDFTEVENLPEDCTHYKNLNKLFDQK